MGKHRQILVDIMLPPNFLKIVAMVINLDGSSRACGITASLFLHPQATGHMAVLDMDICSQETVHLVLMPASDQAAQLLIS